MAEDQKMLNAQNVYAQLCDMLDKEEWSYTKHDEQLMITTGARGEDFPIELIILVDAKRQMIRLHSPMPYTVQEDKRVELAVAVNIANRGMVHGCFDYDIAKGKIYFRMTNSFLGCELDYEVYKYLVYCSCNTVDNYNDKFLLIAKGMLSLEKFIEMENG